MRGRGIRCFCFLVIRRGGEGWGLWGEESECWHKLGFSFSVWKVIGSILFRLIRIIEMQIITAIWCLCTRSTEPYYMDISLLANKCVAKNGRITIAQFFGKWHRSSGPKSS